METQDKLLNQKKDARVRQKDLQVRHFTRFIAESIGRIWQRDDCNGVKRKWKKDLQDLKEKVVKEEVKKSKVICKASGFRLETNY